LNLIPNQFHLSCNESDDRIRADLGVLDHRRYVIKGLVPDGYEPYFQEQARYVSAHTSTAIEGNPLESDAAMRVLVEGADPDIPAEVEKVNLDEAYQLVAQLGSDASLRIDQGLIRALHSLTLKGLPDQSARNRGRYRAGQNLIVDSSTRAVRYIPPPPALVPDLMAGYAAQVNEWRERFPGPVAAAMAHFGLVSIHPFDDGNGRTARLIADLILDLTGWSCDEMLSVSPLLLEKRAGYYAVLRSVQGERFQAELDVTEFVRFHTEQLMSAAIRLEERAVQFNKHRDAWAREFDFLNPRQVTALMFMLDIGPLSSSTLARLTGASQATALTDLAELVKAGAVHRTGAGPRTRYRMAGATPGEA
jgi:Fic family protein